MKNTDFLLHVGLPRSGKSYAMIKSMYNTLIRNVKWYESGKIKQKRFVVSNIKLNDEISEKYKDYIKYFSDEISFKKLVIESKDSDIFIDEISIYFDADNYMNIPFEYKRFLNEYARRGNTIECTTQDASQLYTRARRKVTKILLHRKFGNPSPSPTRPKIKYIWGILLAFPSHFVLFPDGVLKIEKSSIFPSIDFLQRKYVNLYDTREEIKKIKYQIVSHYEYVCEHYHDDKHECNYKKIVHK
jgi:hypothetical protein